MPEVYLSIGSNVEREHYINNSLDALADHFGELHLSPVYESSAVGFVGENFYNLVVGMQTDEPVERLSDCLRDIEAANGRDRNSPKFSDRTLDIDILTYGDQVGQFGHVELPRDEILTHAYVLKPLADMVPEGIHPVEGKTYRELWSAFKDESQSLWEVPFKWRRHLL